MKARIVIVPAFLAVFALALAGDSGPGPVHAEPFSPPPPVQNSNGLFMPAPPAPLVPPRPMPEFTNVWPGFTNPAPWQTNPPPWMTNRPPWLTNRPPWSTNLPSRTNRLPPWPPNHQPYLTNLASH